MKREIKFRVYNGLEMIDNVTVGKFGYFYVNPEKGDGLNPEDTASLTVNTTKYEGAPLMQFTGLKDMAGIDIYEGDILDSETAPQLCIISIDDYHGYQFKFGDGVLCKADALYGVVIGNIYENPELLNK